MHKKMRYSFTSVLLLWLFLVVSTTASTKATSRGSSSSTSNYGRKARGEQPEKVYRGVTDSNRDRAGRRTQQDKTMKKTTDDETITAGDDEDMPKAGGIGSSTSGGMGGGMNGSKTTDDTANTTMAGGMRNKDGNKAPVEGTMAAKGEKGKKSISDKETTVVDDTIGMGMGHDGTGMSSRGRVRGL